MLTTKKCNECGSEKLIVTEFYSNKDRKDGTLNTCKKCVCRKNKHARLTDTEFRLRQNASTERYRNKNKNKVKLAVADSALKAKYDINLEDYQVMLDQQGGCCLICRYKDDRHRLHVDHNHATGEIRGLLCRNCNVSIGHMKDSPKLLRKLADYLETSQNITRRFQ